eukprot:6115241-Prymnesium_polylepis.1
MLRARDSYDTSVGPGATLYEARFRKAVRARAAAAEQCSVSGAQRRLESDMGVEKHHCVSHDITCV